MCQCPRNHSLIVRMRQQGGLQRRKARGSPGVDRRFSQVSSIWSAGAFPKLAPEVWRGRSVLCPRRRPAWPLRRARHATTLWAKNSSRLRRFGPESLTARRIGSADPLRTTPSSPSRRARDADSIPHRHGRCQTRSSQSHQAASINQDVCARVLSPPCRSRGRHSGVCIRSRRGCRKLDVASH